MKSAILLTYDQEVRARWTKRFADSLLKQLSSQSVFLGIDILPGVWTSWRASRRQHWKEK